MKWRTKARLQSAVACLPDRLSYGVYYRLQRYCGGWRTVNPLSRLGAGVQTARLITGQGGELNGKVFFEVGTGRLLSTPLAYWLMGAHTVITLDLHPYLQKNLVQKSLHYIAEHEADLRAMFGDFLYPERLDALLRLARRRDFHLQRLLDLCSIHYQAPANAANTGLATDSVDYHTSYTVLEHVPPSVLQLILTEGRRIVQPDGLLLHCVDYSDHFAYTDPSISLLNFLQFSDAEWETLAGNRYMYMNRLRHDDLLQLFWQLGLEVVLDQPELDLDMVQRLNNGALPLHTRFSGKSNDILATTHAWLVARPGGL